MQKQSRLSLNAAAWFFVGQSDDEGAPQNMVIKTPFRIGRNSGLDLTLPCKSVSGAHAEIRREHDALWLYDLDSTNGTFVNGRRVKSKVRLGEKDTVQFGTSVFHITRDKPADDDSQLADEDSADQLQSERFEKLFNGGVVPFFQPIMRFEGEENSITGYEVLGRSRLFGLRTPAQMFAAASRMEMEAELSRVLRNRGIKVADKNLPQHYSLFVNTHPAELECMGLVASLYEIRDNHSQRPITLEVHESFLNGHHQNRDLLDALETLDVKLAFHDFGNSEIRLAELARIRPDVVKFDVNLIKGIHAASARHQSFVASLVRMMSDLGISPLAECVETAEDHQTLQQMGFKMGQGFLYGRPSSISDCRETAQQPLVKSFLDDPANNEFTVESEVAIVGSDEPHDAKWLLEQPPHHYTIQVLSAISEDRAREHVAMQENPAEFSIFCKQGKTRLLYIVVHGVFDDRAAAKTASTNLANAAVSPWIRLLSSVHAEIDV